MIRLLSLLSHDIFVIRDISRVKVKVISGQLSSLYPATVKNPTEKHIMIHCERGGACSHAFQQLQSGTTQMNPTVQDLSGGQKEAIKIAETTNGYWILLWVSSCDDAENNSVIQQIAQLLGVQPKTCPC